MTEQAERELPTITEELERKTFAELENLVHRVQKGDITNAEYKASINTLFSICSGLVGNGFFEMITAAGEEVINDSSFSRKTLFRKGDKISVMSVASNEDAGFPLIVYSATIFDEKSITGDAIEIRGKVEKFAQKLKSVGFEEIY